jgi:hypothetical protein
MFRYTAADDKKGEEKSLKTWKCVAGMTNSSTSPHTTHVEEKKCFMDRERGWNL